MSQPYTSGSGIKATKDLTPIWWHEAEPARLRRDLDEIAAFAPGLAFASGPGDEPGFEHHGLWIGRLPVWPFDRDEPDGLADLVPEGLACEVWCSAAHPMLPPRIFPMGPEPEIFERSQHTWHVAPDASLCLMQTLGAWEPETSLVDLLIKAAGWRVEYALMKAGVVEAMTECGIVNDSSLDHLVAAAIARLAEHDAGSADLDAPPVSTESAPEGSEPSTQPLDAGPEQGSAA